MGNIPSLKEYCIRCDLPTLFLPLILIFQPLMEHKLMLCFTISTATCIESSPRWIPASLGKLDTRQLREVNCLIQFHLTTILIITVAALYDNIHEQPVRSDVQPGFLHALLPISHPDQGKPWDDISKDISGIIEPDLCHWSHPGFMAYFPASSTFEGILAELYSAAYNGPAFDWVCSPSVTELENIMMTWLAKLLSLPSSFQPTGIE